MTTPLTIAAPSSKSLSHRALMCAALAQGQSVLEGILDSQDLTRTIQCLQQLGAGITAHADQLVVQGIVPGLSKDSSLKDMNVGESGTTCRLMLGIAPAFPGTYRIFGKGRLHDRPVYPLTQALEQQGVTVKFEEKSGCPPVLVSSTGLPGGEVHINLEQSSQYLSALLLAAPLAATPTTIYLEGTSIASWPYVALTLETMARFNVPVTLEYRISTKWQPCSHAQAASFAPADLRLVVQPGTYQPQTIRVEGDWSNASYFLAAGAVGQVPVQVTGLNPASAQGDRAILDILVQMGARILWENDQVTVCPSALHGIRIDMNTCPDIVPTVAVLAAFARGETTITGAAHLTLKECDRIAAPVAELTKAGVTIQARPDGMVIQGQSLGPGTVFLQTYADHRMAMSLSLLELGGLTVSLDHPGCVAKSFPKFWEYWAAIRQANNI